MRHAPLIALLLTALVAPASRTPAQPANPVYADDSPAARDTLDRLGELLESGNLTQAVRALQKLLDEESARTLARQDDAALYRSVRSAVHERLLADRRLLERYREIQGPIAERLLEAEGARPVERARLLTGAGYEAALRLAQTHLELARFEAARMTLEQLERHPDRRDRPEPAARLLTQVAAYLDRPALWQRALRWSAEAGLAEPDPESRRVAERPPRADVPWRWAFEPIDDDLPAAPRRPLWTSSLIPERARVTGRNARGARLPVTPEEVLWILPAASGDTVYTNDGVWITAWDRYTLEVKWRLRPDVGSDPRLSDDIADQRLEPRNFGSRLEDPSTVTVAGRVLVTTTGLAVGGAREGDPRVHAIDAETGRALWSVMLSRLDPRLEQAVPVGPVVVEADTAVVAARKSVPGRRIISVALVGLDLHTGALRWIRPLASAGALPYVRTAGRSDGSVMHEGVCYRVDEIGVIGAVEATSGRPLWIRTMRPQDFARRSTGDVYQTNVPVVHGEAIYVRSTDRRSILKLDLATGELLARQSAGQFGSPRYLIGVGEHLAGVGTERVAFLPFDQFGGGSPAFSPVFQERGVHGRAVAMEGRLVTPTGRGLVVLDPAEPATPEAVVRLERIGNFLPLDSALVVVDDVEIHSYLDWEVAERLLLERMQEDPADPAPAITYAELAFRAGHAEKVPGAAGKALQAVRRTDDEAGAARARQRLFDALRQMVELSQAAWEDATIDEPVIRDLDVMEDVVRRLGQAASGPSQRAAALLVEGRLRDAMLEPGAAVEAYQALLADERLASQQWRQGERRAPAGREAARRIRELVLELGPAPYAPFEAEAARRVEALEGDPGPERLEHLARRYPAASVTSGLWRRAASGYARAGRPADELRCLHNAVLAARVAHRSGTEPDPGPLARAVAAQVRALARRERYSGAAHALHRFASEHPEIDLASAGTGVTTDGLMSELRSSLSSATRPARIGPVLTGRAQAFVGWQLMEPVLRPARPVAGVDHVLLLNADRLALFADVGVDDEGQLGDLVERWDRTIGDASADLLRADPDAVYLAWQRDRGTSVESVDAITGRTRWRTEPFRDLFEEDPAFEQMLANPSSIMPTPQRTNVHLSDTLVAADSGTLLLIERTGRVAAIDEASGDVLWTAHSPVDRVYQADAREGLLVIGGDRNTRPPARRVRGSASIHALDARTGQTVALIDGLPAEPQWVRVASPTRAIVRLRGALAAYDLETGEAAWRIDEDAGATARAAWVFGDDVYLVDATGVLWHASATTGRLTPEPLTGQEQLSSATRIDVMRLGDRVGVFSSDGALLIQGDRLVAADGLRTAGGVVPPVPTESRVVALEAVRRLDEDFQPLHMLHVLGRESLRLERTNVLRGLWDNPRDAAALDARLVVTAGQMTFVYRAPPGGGSSR